MKGKCENLLARHYHAYVIIKSTIEVGSPGPSLIFHPLILSLGSETQLQIDVPYVAL